MSFFRSLKKISCNPVSLYLLLRHIMVSVWLTVIVIQITCWTSSLWSTWPESEEVGHYKHEALCFIAVLWMSADFLPGFDSFIQISSRAGYTYTYHTCVDVLGCKEALQYAAGTMQSSWNCHSRLLLRNLSQLKDWKNSTLDQCGCSFFALTLFDIVLENHTFYE